VSKAFTKDDAPDELPVLRPRAPLPEGVTNYVTARGLGALHDERKRMDDERASLDATADPAERARALAVLAARLAELDDRIASATIIDARAQPHDEVRFGATVRVAPEGTAPRTYQIVGVDEADVAHGRIAFVAPLARALLGKRVGDAAVVQTPRGDEEVQVLAIAYPDDDARAGGEE
jgi:transcription elongation factor GreB